MKSIIGLLFLTKSIFGFECIEPACVTNGDRTTFIAKNSVEYLEITCDDSTMCSRDTTSGNTMKVYTAAKLTILKCLTQDSCKGIELYTGVTPEGYLDSDFGFSDLEPGELILECEDDVACKELSLIGNGNTAVRIKAMGKSSIESSTLDCNGLTNGRYCELQCNNEDIEPCKSVICSDVENNCACESVGLGTYNACPPPPQINVDPQLPISTTTKTTLPPKPYETCTGLGGECRMTGASSKTFICPNSFSDCIVECVNTQSQCQDMKVISGSASTIIRCGMKDSCKNAEIEIGSYTLADYEDFTQDDFEGPKAYAYIQCGVRKRDDTACKDMSVKAYGEFAQFVKIDARSRRAFQGGKIECDIDDHGFGTCQLDCFYSYDSSSCPDVVYDCLTSGDKCECLGLKCPTINKLGDSACDNESTCLITGHGGRIVIPSTVTLARIDCQRSNKQCLDARIYSAATETIVDCGEEGCYGMTVYGGELPEDIVPRGFTVEEFRNPLPQTLTMNCEFDSACKDSKISVYGNIDSYVWSQQRQSFDWSEFNCHSNPGKYCSLNCMKYAEACENTLFICPNMNGALAPPQTGPGATTPQKTYCECINEESPYPNAQDLFKPENSCPEILESKPVPPLNPQPVSRQSAASSNISSKSKGVPREAFYPLVGLAIVGLLCVVGLFLSHRFGITKSYFRVNENNRVSLNSESTY